MAEQTTPQAAPRRSGALQSSLSIDLHSHYAIRLWEGRRRDEAQTQGRKRPEIICMPQAISRAGIAGRDSAAGNPYADQVLVRLEDTLKSATARVQEAVLKMEHVLTAIPAGINLSEVSSVEPLNLEVFSRSPLGYRCVWLLVHFDQLALKVFQAFHYGLISLSERDQYLNAGGHAVRQVYGVIQGYKTVPVTYDDIRNNTARGMAATEKLGEIDPAILSGEKRSSFSPLLTTPAEKV